MNSDSSTDDSSTDDIISKPTTSHDLETGLENEEVDLHIKE